MPTTQTPELPVVPFCSHPKRTRSVEPVRQADLFEHGNVVRLPPLPYAPVSICEPTSFVRFPVAVPPLMPQAAMRIATVRYRNVRVGATTHFYLSTNQPRTEWLLWIDFEDIDDWSRSHVQYTVGWCRRAGTRAHEAAQCLMAGYFSHGRDCLGYDVIFRATRAGLCDSRAIRRLSRGEDAPGTGAQVTP